MWLLIIKLSKMTVDFNHNLLLINLLIIALNAKFVCINHKENDHDYRNQY